MKNNLKKATLCLSHFAIDLYASLFAPIFPIFANNFNLNIAHIGLIMSLSYIGSSFLQPFFGACADKITKCYFVLLGLFCTCLFVGSVGYIKSAILFALVVIIINLGEGLYHPQATILANKFSNSKGGTMGLYVASGLIGFALGPLLSGYITKNYGIVSLKYLSFIGGLIVCFVFFVFKDVRYKINNSNENDGFLNIIYQILRDKNLLCLMLLSISRPLILITFCVYVPFYLSDIGFDSFQIGITVCLFSIVGAIGAYIGGKLYEKVNKINLFSFSLLFTTFFVLSGLFFFKINPYIALFLYIIGSFAININAGINILVAQNIKKNNMGALGGLINGFNWWLVGFSLGIIGYFAKIFTIISVLKVLSLIPLILAIILVFLARKNVVNF